MDNLITIISASFGIIGTSAAIYFNHQNFQIKKRINILSNVPTIELKISNLPPYKIQNEYSILQIKNVGNATSGKLKVSIKCSWYEEMEMYLNFPSENWILRPNEEYSWKLRIPYENLPNNAKIEMKARDGSTYFQIIEKL